MLATTVTEAGARPRDRTAPRTSAGGGPTLPHPGPAPPVARKDLFLFRSDS